MWWTEEQEQYIIAALVLAVVWLVWKHQTKEGATDVSGGHTLRVYGVSRSDGHDPSEQGKKMEAMMPYEPPVFWPQGDMSAIDEHQQKNVGSQVKAMARELVKGLSKSEVKALAAELAKSEGMEDRAAYVEAAGPTTVSVGKADVNPY